MNMTLGLLARIVLADAAVADVLSKAVLTFVRSLLLVQLLNPANELIAKGIKINNVDSFTRFIIDVLCGLDIWLLRQLFFHVKQRVSWKEDPLS
jgi:hypothetical protein